MRILSRSLFVVVAGLSMALSAGAPSAAQNQDDPRSDRVWIPTFDGMELGGTFYPAMGKADKDAVVMCLHDFSHRRGGGSHGEWDGLAARLQKEGYAVLTFDFRGFGNSKSVGPAFWMYPFNRTLRGWHNGINSAKSIDQKDFTSTYSLNLINDIAAARAFLDRKNDSRELNTSNLIVVGAGQGATLGALWVAAEMHRRRDVSPPGLLGLPPAVPVRLDDPEGRDIAAAFWLTISPTLEGRNVTSAVRSALVEVVQDNKVPTVFIFGSNDDSAVNLAATYKKAMESGPRNETVDLMKINSGTKTIAGTGLTGSALLGDRLATTSFLIKHMGTILEERGSREWRKREEKKARSYWTAGKRGGRPMLAKLPGEKVARPIPLELLRINH